MRQNGNALFLILIAVTLFAGLSYAITQTSRSGSANIDKEEIQIKATRIAQHAGELTAAVNRLQTINGCTPEEIDFGINYTAPSFDCWGDPPNNPARRTDGSCDVYSEAGGGVTPEYFDVSYCSPIWNTCAFVPMTIAIDGIGTAAGEDLVWWSHAVDVEICRAINEELGIDSNLSATWYDVGSSYLSSGGEDTIAGEFSGQMDGCYFQ